MRRTDLMIIIACLSFFGCKQATKEVFIYEDKDEEISIEKKLIIEEFDENQILKFSDIFQSVEFVKLETNDTSLIGRIDKILVADNKYIILDASIAKKVFVFDSNGKFLNLLGKIGAGPGEYDSPDDIAYNKQKGEVLVWSNNDKKIITYKLDGQYVSEFRTNWWISSLAVVDSEAYALYLNNITQDNGKTNDYDVVIVNNEGEIINQFIPSKKELKSFSPSTKKAFSSYNGKILFSPQYSKRTYEINKDSINLTHYVDFMEYTIPSSLFINTTARKLSKILEKEDKYAFNISSAETENYVFMQIVYKNRIFDYYYYKDLKKYKLSSLYFNDLSSLVLTGVFMCTDNANSLISYVEPESFILMQDVLKEINVSNQSNLGTLIYKKILSMKSTNLSKSTKKNYMDIANSISMKISDEELNFIRNVKSSDNPIIRIAKLKTDIK